MNRENTTITHQEKHIAHRQDNSCSPFYYLSIIH